MHSGSRRRALGQARARFLLVLGVPALACGASERPVVSEPPTTNIPPPEPASETELAESEPVPAPVPDGARRCGPDQVRELACSESAGDPCAPEHAWNATTYIRRIEINSNTAPLQHDPVLTRDVQALNPNRPLCCFARCTDLQVAAEAPPILEGGATRISHRCVSMPDVPSRLPSAEHDNCPAAIKPPHVGMFRRFHSVRPSTDPPDARPASWKSDLCCYEHESRMLPVGRPLFRDGARCLPDDRALASGDPVIEHWHTMARGEHASVAAFEELGDTLRELGAPADLIERVAVAASDEARHAALCYKELSRMIGEPCAPGRVPPPTKEAPDIRELAISTLRDGCFEETLGALLARELAACMPAGEKRRIFSQIYKDELGHASLAFRILAFCVKRDPRLASDLRAELAHLEDECAHVSGAVDARWEAEGLPSKARVQSLARAVLDDVVTPCVHALLEQPRGDALGAGYG